MRSLFRHLLRPVRWIQRKRRALGAPITLDGAGVAQLLQLDGFQMYVDPVDTLIGRMIWERGCYEPYATRILRDYLRPGSNFLDVGANIGYHSLVAARLVGKQGYVISVEMSSRNARLLQASCDMNAYKWVHVCVTAVAETEQDLEFCVTPGTGNGMIVSDVLRPRLASEPDRFSPAIRVHAVPLDRVVPEGQRIDVMKLDIEGSELRALQGAERILGESRPVILFEYCPTLLKDIGGTRPEALLEFLRHRQYRLQRVCTARPPSLDRDESDESLLQATATKGLIDILALPAEKSSCHV